MKDEPADTTGDYPPLSLLKREFEAAFPNFAEAKASDETPDKTPEPIEDEAADPKRPFACTFCDKSFPFRSVLAAHLRTHTGEKPFLCGECGKAFAQKGSLTIHQRRHSGQRPYRCAHCPKTFASQGNCKTHERLHSGEKRFGCAECPRAFATASGLRSHRLLHSAPSDKDSADPARASEEADGAQVTKEPAKPRHACFCGKSFAYASVLEAHLRSHTGERPFPCSYCPKRFTQKATLQVHERIHTGEKPYQCSFCPRAFAQYGTKAVHENSHLGLRSYKCGECGKGLSSPSALYTHRKTHGERRHRCPDCPKAFTLPNYLKLHRQHVHRPRPELHAVARPAEGSLAPAPAETFGVKVPTVLSPESSLGSLGPPSMVVGLGSVGTGSSTSSESPSPPAKAKREAKDFTCKYCGKRFAYASSLYVHTRLHTGERPFKCRFCHKAFTNQGNAQVHERVHTGEKPYKCLYCPKAYAQKVGLNIHLEQCPQRAVASVEPRAAEADAELLQALHLRLLLQQSLLGGPPGLTHGLPFPLPPTPPPSATHFGLPAFPTLAPYHLPMTNLTHPAFLHHSK